MPAGNLLTGCLALPLCHSDLLRKYVQIKIDELQNKHPHAKIVFASATTACPSSIGLYFACWNVMRGAGFDGSSALAACCGARGSYSYNATAACGLPGRPWRQTMGLHLSDNGLR